MMLAACFVTQTSRRSWPPGAYFVSVSFIDNKISADIFVPTILLTGMNVNTMLHFLLMNGVHKLVVFVIPPCIANTHVCSFYSS